jgi:hypothetical protein
MDNDLSIITWLVGGMFVVAALAFAAWAWLWSGRLRSFFARRAAAKARRQELEAYARDLRSQR